MKLEALTLDQCQQVRIWRNDCLETLRTPYPLTESQQLEFYRDVVYDRNSPHRYFAIIDDINTCNHFIGMGGITNIQWENRIGEISLIIDPARRGKGEGGKAVDLLLGNAFNCLNLQTVFGECYMCNSAHEFWSNLTERYIDRDETVAIRSNWHILPNRKYWQGKYYDSLYFSIDKKDFNAKTKSNS